MKYANILKAAKVEAIDFLPSGLASEADGHLLSAEVMNNLEAVLAEHEAAAATAAEQLATAQATIAQHEATIQQQQAAAAELATAQATIAQHQATIQTLQEQVAALGSKTDTPADTSTGGEEKTEGKQTKKPRYAHDAYADQLLSN